MFVETQCLRTAAPLLSRVSASVHRGADGRRHLSVSRRLSAKVRPVVRPREKVDIPGLEPITYAHMMHWAPGLAKPVNPPWERAYIDPQYYKSPPAEEMPLYKEKACYVFNQRTSALEGLRQALWLTKSQLTSGLPPQLLSLAQDPVNQIPDQDERVKNAIKNARFWDTTEIRPRKETYSPLLLTNLIHLCATLQSKIPALGRRMPADCYSLGASWTRGEDLFQIRGQSGLLHTCMDPIPPVSGKQEVADTADHVLESFYPVSPTIDLQQIHTYKKEVNCTGFKDGYPYPHAHTLYFTGNTDPRWKLRSEQLRAKMLMFAFGNALARAHLQYGTQPLQTLDQPITVQAVSSNGRIFEFVVFQLNTTDFSGDEGIKNQVWLDEEVVLYDFAKVKPLIKRKEVKVPAGLAGYNPETFSKFLGLYLNGAV